MDLGKCDVCRQRPAVVLRYCGRCALDAIGTAPVRALEYVEALRPEVLPSPRPVSRSR